MHVLYVHMYMCSAIHTYLCTVHTVYIVCLYGGLPTCMAETSLYAVADCFVGLDRLLLCVLDITRMVESFV